MRRYLLVLAFLLALPGTAAASTLYASPGGTAMACTEANPCALGQAFTSAETGDTISLDSGLYGVGTLTDGGKDLTIAGVTGARRPTIFNSSLTLTGEDSILQDVFLVQDTGTAVSLDGGATADRIIATSSNGTAVS